MTKLNKGVAVLVLFFSLFVTPQAGEAALKRLPQVKNLSATVIEESGDVRIQWKHVKKKKFRKYLVQVKQDGELIQQKKTKKRRAKFSASLFEDGEDYVARVRVRKNELRRASKWRKTTFTYNQPGTPDVCGTAQEFFSVSPVSTENLWHIQPLGNVNPTGHTFPTRHTYWNLDADIVDEDYTENLLAPGNMWVTEVRVSENITDDITDYAIYFKPCDEYTGYFGHVLSISAELEAQLSEGTSSCFEYETGGKSYRLCNYEMQYEVPAGATLGTIGTATFDLGGRDSRITPLEFANNDRWSEDSRATVCPLDYFTPEVKEELYGFLGYQDERRTQEPRCGTSAADIAGTLQGAWFSVTTGSGETNEDSSLALIYENEDPATAVFSVGTAGGSLASGIYQFNIAHSGTTNRAFEETTTETTYCYAIQPRFGGGVLGALLVRLTNASTMQFEYFNGQSCDTPPSFTSSAVAFYR